MNIARIDFRGISVTPKTNWCFLEVHTEDGLVGLGECTLANQEAHQGFQQPPAFEQVDRQNRRLPTLVAQGPGLGQLKAGRKPVTRMQRLRGDQQHAPAHRGL